MSETLPEDLSDFGLDNQGIPLELSAIKITDARFIDNFNNPIPSLDDRLMAAVAEVESNTPLAGQAMKYLALRGFVGKDAVTEARNMAKGDK